MARFRLDRVLLGAQIMVILASVAVFGFMALATLYYLAGIDLGYRELEGALVTSEVWKRVTGF